MVDGLDRKTWLMDWTERHMVGALDRMRHGWWTGQIGTWTERYIVDERREERKEESKKERRI